MMTAITCCAASQFGTGNGFFRFLCAQGVTVSVQMCLGSGYRKKLWFHSSRVVSSRVTADSDKDEWLKRARD